jgi:hypothetical protein
VSECIRGDEHLALHKKYADRFQFEHIGFGGLLLYCHRCMFRICMDNHSQIPYKDIDDHIEVHDKYGADFDIIVTQTARSEYIDFACRKCSFRSNIYPDSIVPRACVIEHAELHKKYDNYFIVSGSNPHRPTLKCRTCTFSGSALDKNAADTHMHLHQKFDKCFVILEPTTFQCRICLQMCCESDALLHTTNH